MQIDEIDQRNQRNQRNPRNQLGGLSFQQIQLPYSHEYEKDAEGEDKPVGDCDGSAEGDLYIHQVPPPARFRLVVGEEWYEQEGEYYAHQHEC